MPIPLFRYQTSLLKDREPINKIKKYYNIFGNDLIKRDASLAGSYTVIMSKPLNTNGIIKQIKLYCPTVPPSNLITLKLFKKTEIQFIFIKDYNLNITSNSYTQNLDIQVKHDYYIGFYSNDNNIANSNTGELLYYHLSNIITPINIVTLSNTPSDISMRIKIKYKKDKHYAI